MTEELKDKVIAGEQITQEQALWLIKNAPLESIFYSGYTPNYLNNLITSLSSSIGNGNIQTGSTYFTEGGGTLQVPIKNPRILFFGCPSVYNQFYLFICVYPFTHPVCIYYSSDRDGSFTNTGTYCSWSSTRVTFSISWGISGTWYYFCESIK